MSNYNIIGSDVIFPSGNKVCFKYKINSEILEHNGVLILTLEVPARGDWLQVEQSEDYNRNVFGIDIKNEKLLWQIESLSRIYGAYHGPQIRHSGPDEIFLWGHPDIIINPYSGKVIEKIPRKSVWD